MKKILIGLIVGLLPVANAAADDLYYVELGKADSEKAAEQEWQEMLDAHTALLGDLEYFPRTIYHAGNRKQVHMYAGPIEEKNDANRLCKKLFRENISCFIVEGLPAGYKQMLAKPQPKEEILPWLVDDQKIANARPADKDKGIMEWVAAKPAQAPESETKMQVAEAIRVPLSDRENAPASGRLVVADNKVAGGWLKIEFFDSQESAHAFWKKLSSAAPHVMSGLRERIVKPLSANQVENISLNLGPFASDADAMEFCAGSVKKIDGNLSCQFDLGQDSAYADAQGNSRSEQYNNRRRRPVGNNLTANANVKLYWLEVAESDTQMGALAAWEAVKKANADVLDGVRSSVAPIEGGKSYAVRLGPVSTNEEAVDICYKLKENGARCHILGNM